jgi:dinuclear metal center YbgI/SA1388 family protein
MSIDMVNLLSILNEISPESLAEPWDHSGIQINPGKARITRIMVCLDVTNAIIDEAVNNNIELIISHHPLIFNPIYKIDNNNFMESLIIRLIQANIGVYAMHTSFDKVEKGNNDYLADLLGLKELEILIPEESNKTMGLGRIGKLMPARTLGELIDALHRILTIKTPVSYVGNKHALITKVALCTGAGGNYIKLAAERGCDVLITGDVGYHDALLAAGIGLSVIDGGHYYTEQLFIENVACRLNAELENKVEILASKLDQNPFNML